MGNVKQIFTLQGNTGHMVNPLDFLSTVLLSQTINGESSYTPTAHPGYTGYFVTNGWTSNAVSLSCRIIICDKLYSDKRISNNLKIITIVRIDQYFIIPRVRGILAIPYDCYVEFHIVMALYQVLNIRFSIHLESSL